MISVACRVFEGRRSRTGPKKLFNSNHFDGVVIMAKTGAKEKEPSERKRQKDKERLAKERGKNERIEEIKDWRPDTEGLLERTTETIMDCLQQLWLGRLWLRQYL